jgi:hypothetical protein
MAEQVSFDVNFEYRQPPTEIGVEGGTKVFFNSAFAYGNMFRDFVRRLPDQGKIELIRGVTAQSLRVPGTFFFDVISLLEEDSNLNAYMVSSKLNRIHSQEALMRLYNRGVCQITPYGSSEVFGHGLLPKELHYIQLFASIKNQCFANMNSSAHPGIINDLVNLARSVDGEDADVFFLDNQGNLTERTIECIHSQGRHNPERALLWKTKVNNLIRFLLQAAQDNLPGEIVESIKKSYREQLTEC